MLRNPVEYIASHPVREVLGPEFRLAGGTQSAGGSPAFLRAERSLFAANAESRATTFSVQRDTHTRLPQQVGGTVAPRRLREHRVLRFVRQHGLDGLVAHHVVLQAFGVAVSLQVFEVGESLGEREAELVVGEVL